MELAQIQQAIERFGKNSGIDFLDRTTKKRASSIAGAIITSATGRQSMAQQRSLISHKGMCKFSSKRKRIMQIYD